MRRFYCKYNYKNNYYESYAHNGISNKTTELIHFLKKMIDESFLKEFRNPYADLAEEGESDEKYTVYIGHMYLPSTIPR